MATRRSSPMAVPGLAATEGTSGLPESGKPEQPEEQPEQPEEQPEQPEEQPEQPEEQPEQPEAQPEVQPEVQPEKPKAAELVEAVDPYGSKNLRASGGHRLFNPFTRQYFETNDYTSVPKMDNWMIVQYKAGLLADKEEEEAAEAAAALAQAK